MPYAIFTLFGTGNATHKRALFQSIQNQDGSCHVSKMKPKSGLRDYKPGTFDRYVAYGQRDRKLMLVARGILKGFRVKCRTEREAHDLAYALRIRAPRVELREGARFGLKVKLDGKTVYVFGTPKRTG